MKTVNKFLLALAVAPLAFTACEENIERTPAQPETEGAYFLETNQTEYTFLPADTVKFEVALGRVNGSSAETVKMDITDKKGVFVLPDSVVFEAGVTVKNIEVTAPDMTLGMSADLELALPEDVVVSKYGSAGITISVMKDYEWISRGTVTYTDAAFGLGESSCGIYQAKGTNLFKIADPYKGLEAALQSAGMGSDWEMPTGYSLQFTMDTVNWTISDTDIPNYGQDIGMLEFSSYLFYWAPEYVGSYLGVTSAGNSYVITAFITDMTSLYGPVPFAFVWDEATFPGKLIDPAEGDGVMEINMNMTAGLGRWFGDGGETDKYGRSLYSNYYLMLADDNGSEVALDLYAAPSDIVASFAGKYTIGTAAEVGSALAGYNSADGIVGSYAYYAPTNTVLYLTAGTVTVTDETDGTTSVQVNATNAAGDSIKVSYQGALQIVDMVNTPSTTAKSTLAPRHNAPVFKNGKLEIGRKPVANIKL